MGWTWGMYGGHEMHSGSLMGRRDGKRSFGRPGPRWEYNIKIYIQELGSGSWTRMLWVRIGKVGWRL
jgi:hypothetical protein